MSTGILAVNNMGASVGAVTSAVYPAISTVLAFLFLKERVKWYRWIFLIFTLLGVYGISYSPTVNIENFWLGLFGAFMCTFDLGIETVILAKCLKYSEIKNEYALTVRQTTSALIYDIIILPVLDDRSLCEQYPSRTSELKTVHRTVLFTLLTLSEFESS